MIQNGTSRKNLYLMEMQITKEKSCKKRKRVTN